MDTDVTSNFHVKPRYLIFGASGFLGSRIFEVLSDNWDTFGTFHNASMPQSNKMRKVNLSEEAEMLRVIEEIKPSHIINCSGLTNVEKCELLPEVSWKLNSEIPFRLAKFSADFDIRFIHISTDHFESPFSGCFVSCGSLVRPQLGLQLKVNASIFISRRVSTCALVDFSAMRKRRDRA